MAHLEEFAVSLELDKDQVHAVHASRTEWHIEGPYWLALLLGKAYQTSECLSLKHVSASHPWACALKYYNLHLPNTGYG